MFGITIQDFHLSNHKNFGIDIFDTNIDDNVLTLDTDKFIGNLNADVMLKFETSLILANTVLSVNNIIRQFTDYLTYNVNRSNVKPSNVNKSFWNKDLGYFKVFVRRLNQIKHKNSIKLTYDVTLKFCRDNFFQTTDLSSLSRVWDKPYKILTKSESFK